jgi:hypothetical protein
VTSIAIQSERRFHVCHSRCDLWSIASTTVSLLVVTALVGPACDAADWRVVGSRQRAMGGAGVATADDTSAIYWNPAAVGFDTSWGVRLDAGFGIAFAPGTISELDSLVQEIQALQAAYNDLQASLTAIDSGSGDQADLVDIFSFLLNELSGFQRHDLGMFIDADIGAKVHMRKVAVSAGMVAYFDGGLVADLTSLALSMDVDNALETAYERLDTALAGTPLMDYYDAADGLPYEVSQELIQIMNEAGVSGATSNEVMADTIVYFASHPVDGAGADLSDPRVRQMLTNIIEATVEGTGEIVANETGIRAQGALVQEYAVAASIPIIPQKLSIGASLKLMSGSTYAGSATYDPLVGTSSLNDAMQVLIDDIDGNGFAETNQIGIDLGVLWRPNRFLNVGLAGKNVNSPSFALPTGDGMFTLAPQWRAGVAVMPTRWITCALDMDVTENRSQVAQDFGARFLALGVEVSVLKILQVRAGMYGNLLAEGAKPAYTAGLGVKLGSAFSLDLAANLSGDIAAAAGIITDPDNAEIADIPEATGLTVSLQFNTKF